MRCIGNRVERAGRPSGRSRYLNTVLMAAVAVLFLVDASIVTGRPWMPLPIESAGFWQEQENEGESSERQGGEATEARRSERQEQGRGRRGQGRRRPTQEAAEGNQENAAQEQATENTENTESTENVTPPAGEGRRARGEARDPGATQEGTGPAAGRAPRTPGASRGQGGSAVGGRGRATRDPAPTEPVTVPDAWMSQFQWEPIGPANMSGRITALAVYEKDPFTWWAASASGGLLKTVNNGFSFEHQFDRESVVSIGDVQVFQQDANVVWVGTGEANPRNSVSWGNGVHKSTDGGKTWQHLGLDKTFQIGRMALHPTDVNVAYVGALGRLWGPNEERGVFKTVDGGATWEKVLYIDDKTGIIDLQMHPTNPDILVAATYERLRDGFDGNDPVKKFGPGSGIYKTVDAGKTWQKMTTGLPTCNLGRIGLNWSRSNPDHLYAIIESEEIGGGPKEVAYLGIRNEAADVGIRITDVVADGPSNGILKTNDILLQMDDSLILKADDMTKFLAQKGKDDEVKLLVVRDGEKVEAVVKLAMREVQVQAPRGAPARPFSASLGGQRENVQDLQGPEGYQYGGVYRSTDAGETWVRINSVNPRPMYYSQIRVDPTDENNIYVLGTSLYKSSDGGVTFTGDGHGNEVHVDHHSMWIDPRDSRHIILGNDGGIYVTHDRMKTWDHHNHVAIGQFYHVGLDATADYKVYGGLQDNGSWGGPRHSRNGSSINSDWFRIGGGDGFICLVDPEDPDQLYAESQNGAMSRFNLRTGERGSIRPQAPQGTRYRFNWKTPFILSPHNSRIHYSAGNYVFRSLNKGTAVASISPEITNTDQGSGSAISESPVEAGVLYVGTTDGAVWVTQNGGQDWRPIYHVPAPKAEASAEAETPADGESAAEAAATEQRPRGNRGRPRREANRGEAGGRGQAAERSEEAGRTEASETKAEETKAEETEKKESGEKSEATQQAEQMKEETAKPPKEDLLTGDWDGQFSTSDGEIAGEFLMSLKLGDANAVSGEMTSDEGSLEMADGVYDPEKKTLKFTIETPLGPIQPLFELEGETLTAQLPLPNGSVLTITATKRPPVRPLHTRHVLAMSQDAEAAEPQEDAEPAEASDATPAPGSLASLMPGPRWVSSIEASRHAAGRCYITLDGHRSNDDQLYVFMTEDYGQNWKSIRGNLPDTAGIAWVVREDLVNPNVLYLGCEMSCWVSIDRGLSWSKFSSLPTVAVHELAQHPTNGEMVAATHGRSLWVLDVSAIRQMTPDVMAKSASLMQPNEVIRWRSLPERGSNSTREFQAATPNRGATVFYSLARPASSAVLTVSNITGKELYRQDVPTEAGLHRVEWNLRTPPPAGARGGRFGRFGSSIPNGTYLIRLQVGDDVLSQTLTVSGDPAYPADSRSSQDLEMEFDREEGDENDGFDEALLEGGGQRFGAWEQAQGVLISSADR